MKISSLLLFVILLCSCNKNFDEFIGTEIEFVYDSLKEYKCRNVDDSLQTEVKIIKYYASIECGSCIANNLLSTEELCYEHYKNVAEYQYVINYDGNAHELLKFFYDKHIRGTIYLDTCGIFRKANPQIPENEMFHTFVINNDGKVLMVGDPFMNEKMEALFKKVIANERKKHKAKKSV